MKKLGFCVAAVAAVLSGCGAPSVEELVDDPKLLEKVAQECSEMKRSEAKEDEGCQNLQLAAQKLASEQMEQFKSMMNGMFNK